VNTEVCESAELRVRGGIGSDLLYHKNAEHVSEEEKLYGIFSFCTGLFSGFLYQDIRQ
jgi:hypothetical protein